MGIEALYAIEFTADRKQWQGGGVFVLDTGRVFGGDSSLAYVGEFQLKDSSMVATVDVIRHNNTLPSIFGTKEAKFTVELQGTVSKPAFASIDFTGRRTDMPQITMYARAKRIAELP